jgi:D-3-phosphoglycerate dehydrogenase / 2-oxoglutarate reductase
MSSLTEMSAGVETLLLDLLEWLDDGPRPYAEVMDAWRTSCPRLPVWEEANARRYVVRRRVPAGGVAVALSDAGAAHLRRNHGVLLLRLP